MMDKITTINGILMTAQNDFTEHVENTTVHVTEQEKEKWNKAPVTDAAGNMSLSGNLKAKGGTFSNAINAAGGVNIPIIPGDGTDAVRKADLTKPLIPMLSSQQENGVGFYHKLGNAFTAGGVTTCVSEDFPFIMSEHRIIGGGDDNLYAWYPTTFVLELNTLFNYGQIDAMNESTSKFGVRANFGPCYKPWFAVFWVAWPPVTWPYRQNDYADPLIYSYTENEHGGPVASVWPGNTGGDFLPRCGFQSTQRPGGVRDNSHYLYAVYDRYKTARFIVFRETNSHYQGRKRLYLFSQGRDGSIKLVGAMKSSYAFSHHLLSMSRHGVSGAAGWWARKDDPFDLVSKVQESWIGGQRPADDCSWPLRQSLFDVLAEGSTLNIELTCEDKSYTCVNCPDWITWLDGEGGTGAWQLLVTPNNTGSARQGLVNVLLYNGITYTIVVNQQG